MVVMYPWLLCCWFVVCVRKLLSGIFLHTRRDSPHLRFNYEILWWKHQQTTMPSSQHRALLLLKTILSIPPPLPSVSRRLFHSDTDPRSRYYHSSTTLQKDRTIDWNNLLTTLLSSHRTWDLRNPTHTPQYLENWFSCCMGASRYYFLRTPG